MPQPNKVVSKIQLLVEGNDQRNFFEALVDYLSLKNIQMQNFGGVSELRSFVSQLAKSDEFMDSVESIGIVRDAETSAQSAFRSVQGSLSSANLVVPSRPRERAPGSPDVSVLILPNDSDSGMLESLLCRTFADTPVGDCIEEFLECVRSVSAESLRNHEKSRAHAFLSTRSRPEVSVGVAAQRGYWNLDHTAFDGVRDFLRSL